MVKTSYDFDDFIPLEFNRVIEFSNYSIEVYWNKKDLFEYIVKDSKKTIYNEIFATTELYDLCFRFCNVINCKNQQERDNIFLQIVGKTEKEMKNNENKSNK